MYIYIHIHIYIYIYHSTSIRLHILSQTNLMQLICWAPPPRCPSFAASPVQTFDATQRPGHKPPQNSGRIRAEAGDAMWE